MVNYIWVFASKVPLDIAAPDTLCCWKSYLTFKNCRNNVELWNEYMNSRLIPLAVSLHKVNLECVLNMTSVISSEQDQVLT